ncbi:MAG TPA: Fic family protein [Conexibacter sp.]|jgi:Fic family protein|nr:Fic family protein [Conexibacter sp.]
MPTPRSYEASHPWITFVADLTGLSFHTWLLLGEASARSGHVGRALLRPDVAEDLLRVYLVRGALASTAIEGNTLSEEEARLVADGSLRLPPSREYLGQEINNVIGAFNEIRAEVFDHDGEPDGDVPITVEQIKRWNRQALADLEVGEDVVPGEIRTHSVVVGTYRGAPAGDCEHLLERLCAWLNAGDFSSDDPRLRAPLAIVKAVFAHLYLAWIHPFGDGNGRTARLLELQILLSSGFAIPTTQLLSNHYNATRTEYYRQLDLASRSQSPIDFVHYAVEGFVDELYAQLDRIWSMQYADRWEQFLYESFGEVRTDSERRRLRLVKDLSRASIVGDGSLGPLPRLRSVPRHEIRHLSPQLAELYAGKTERTLSRDLEELIERDLIWRSDDGYRPASDRVLAFMPPARGREGLTI